MKLRRRIRSAFIVPVAALVLATAANAGTTSYDMRRILIEPHPFASEVPPLPPTIITLNSFGASSYSTPGVAQYTGLLGQKFGASTSSGINNSNSSTVAARKQPTQLSQSLPRSNDPSFLTMGAGYYDINDNQGAVEVRAEWRGKKLFWHIHPLIGAMGTGDGALYGYVGAAVDMFFGKRVVVTPSFAVGAYTDGHGKDLGHTIEFRSAVELAWRFDNQMRLGLTLYHLSNASIGDSNPGTEVLSLGLSIPLD